MKAIFFIFSVAVERWCRLRGNLLFYFKSRDHWSEPAGVIVIEGCEVKPDVNPLESTFGILLIFGGGEMLKNIFFWKRWCLGLNFYIFLLWFLLLKLNLLNVHDLLELENIDDQKIWYT